MATETAPAVCAGVVTVSDDVLRMGVVGDLAAAIRRGPDLRTIDVQRFHLRRAVEGEGDVIPGGGGGGERRADLHLAAGVGDLRAQRARVVVPHGVRVE